MATTPLAHGAVVIVGLGNSGAQYERTRHNAGFRSVEEIARDLGEKFSPNKKVSADICEARVGGRKVILAKPWGFMNNSGGPVQRILQFFKVPASHLFVICDELDVDLGQWKIKVGGGDNAHNGLRSISQALGTKEYGKVAVGIGRPPGRMKPADYVLKPFSPTEAAELPIVADEVWRELSARL